MKICAAQLKPKKGLIDHNLTKHLELINLAIRNDINLVFFPELSLTGFEPTLAKELSFTADDPRLDVFQQISDKSNIIICIGVPLKIAKGILISLVIFQPNKERQVYAKQSLHQDEFPYFIQGTEQVFITLGGLTLAPAICYESLLDTHVQQVIEQNASVYLASVAKHKASVEKGYAHYAKIAKENNITVLMANSHGQCDNFESCGSSAVWNQNGACLAQLGRNQDGLVGLDTVTNTSILIHA